MPATTRALLFALAACVLAASCSRTDPNRKQTFPVTGEVYVDGKPARALAVTCHDVKGLDTKNPTLSSAHTQEDGKFAISTYQQSDGVPEGEYVLTFLWGQMNTFSNTYGGPDKLNGRYKDPKESKVRAKVEKGKPTDMGRIDLTTK